MTDGTDWFAWHADYQDESSPLSRRLRIVQRHIAGWLDERGDNGVTVVSACAGQGHDLIDVLDQRADAGRVHATLIESDPRNVRAARAAATAARLANVVPPNMRGRRHRSTFAARATAPPARRYAKVGCRR